MSRIWGLPVGPEAGRPHDASFVDVTCVLLEAAFVLVGYELLARPERGAGLRASSLAALAVLRIGIVAVTTAAVTSPSGAEHAHGTLAAAADGLEVDLPDQPEPVTYGPPPHADGDLPAYLYDWDPDLVDWTLRD